MLFRPSVNLSSLSLFIFSPCQIDESKSISEDDYEFSRKDEIMCTALEEIS